jgi:Rieske Fe-S protein
LLEALKSDLASGHDVNANLSALRTITRRDFLRAVGAATALVACGPNSGGSDTKPSATGHLFVLPTPGAAFAAGKPDDYPVGTTTIFTAKKVGLLRDNDGLSAVRTECTYGLCTVWFYAAGQHWKCPCHGDEFDRHGFVVKGPATRALQTVSVALRPDGTLQVDPGMPVAPDFRLPT